MGGGYYDRDVYSAPAADSSSGQTYSSQAQASLSQRGLHPDLNPKDRQLVCNGATGIVVALDVTGSMGNWSRIIYDKLPMFFGQLLIQEYVQSPEICFSAIGDAQAGDRAPFQVTEFKSGQDIDSQISKLYLEGGGGGNGMESYLLPMYFFGTDRVTFSSHAPRTKPFFFITGDEALYPKLDKKVVHDLIDGDARGVRMDSGEYSWTREAVAQQLMKKYHVFHVKKPYSGAEESRNKAMWESLLGPERVLMLTEAKACVDIMLGAIAITTGQRTLEEYVEDLKERGQTEQRQEDVRAALANLREYDPSAEEAEDIARRLAGTAL